MKWLVAWSRLQGEGLSVSESSGESGADCLLKLFKVDWNREGVECWEGTCRAGCRASSGVEHHGIGVDLPILPSCCHFEVSASSVICICIRICCLQFV